MKRALILLASCVMSVGLVYQLAGPVAFNRLVANVSQAFGDGALFGTSKDIDILWVGDIVPPENQDYARRALVRVAPIIQGADVSLGNLEGTFAESPYREKCGLESECFSFRGVPQFAGVLRAAGFDALSLANNHSFDFGADGLRDTEAVLAQYFLPFVSPTKPVAYIEKKGVRIGLVGISSSPPASLIDNHEAIARLVSEAKKESDLVLVLFHGGAEGRGAERVPFGKETYGGESRGALRAMARVAIEAGADAVLGSGPHVLRGIEFHHGKPIAYSLGNFVGAGKLSVGDVLGRSAALKLRFAPSGEFVKGEIVSLRLSEEGIPLPDETREAVATIERLSRIDFGDRGAVFFGNYFK